MALFNNAISYRESDKMFDSNSFSRFCSLAIRLRVAFEDINIASNAHLPNGAYMK